MLDELKKKLYDPNIWDKNPILVAIRRINNKESDMLLWHIAADERLELSLREMACSALGIKPPMASKTPENPKFVAKQKFISSIKLDNEADFILYYIRVIYNKRYFYKIGVTTSSIEARFKEDFKNIDKVIFSERVIGALKAERDILTRFKEDIFPLAVFRSGASEFFDRDVLNLDDE